MEMSVGMEWSQRLYPNLLPLVSPRATVGQVFSNRRPYEIDAESECPLAACQDVRHFMIFYEINPTW